MLRRALCRAVCPWAKSKGSLATAGPGTTALAHAIANAAVHAPNDRGQHACARHQPQPQPSFHGPSARRLGASWLWRRRGVPVRRKRSRATTRRSHADVGVTRALAAARLVTVSVAPG